MKNALKLIAIMLFVWAMASCTKDPNNGGGHGTNNNYEYVDLGLPSGTLWATKNVGVGYYGYSYAWGETAPKSSYKWSTYKYSAGGSMDLTKYVGFDYSYYGYNDFADGLTVLLPEDDAATVNWGDEWCTPTYEQWAELLEYTTRTVADLDEVGLEDCMVFQGPNGNSIKFIINKYSDEGQACWCSTRDSDPRYGIAVTLHSIDFCQISGSLRYQGYKVRPVRKTP